MLSFMKLKRDTKFGEEMTCRFKIGIRNITNFDLSTQIFERFPLNWAPFEQIICCLNEKVERSYISWHWRVMQNLKKYPTRCLENDMWDWTSFHKSTQKCENWNFVGIHLPKVENLWPYRGVMCHGNEEWYKNWRGTDMSF